MLRLRKTYVVFRLGDRARKPKNVKGLRQTADGTVVGNISGVFFKFHRSRVVVFGAIGDAGSLSHSAVDTVVANVTGVGGAKGKVVMQVFHAHLPTITSAVKLALLHNRIAARPPRGLLTSTLDYQVSDKLVAKLCPYRDGFAVTIRVSCDGAVEISGDGRGCAHSVPAIDAFLRRCEDVLRSVVNC